jgi:23S rRNA pseudouridine2605 synthase
LRLRDWSARFYNASVKERIQKLLAAAGVASRRAVEEMVLQGRIEVNGDVVTALPVMVDPRQDKVAVDGQAVRLAKRVSSERVYLLMNKPKGVYATNVAQGEQMRVIDLLPPTITQRVYPVGRLDAEARGLLLLTNDGDLTNRLTHPRFGVAKTYRAVVDGFISPDQVQQLEQGIWISDPRRGNYKTGRSRIKIVKRARDKSILEITVRESRNPQVRRMFARVGHKVRELTRIRMGPLELHGLAAGQVRELTARELRELRAATETALQTKQRTHKPVRNHQ